MNTRSIDPEVEDYVVRPELPPEEPAPQLPAVQQLREDRSSDQRRERPQMESEHGLYDTQIYEHMLRIARVMAEGSLIPETLYIITNSKKQKEALPFRTVLANCFLIVNQARLWKVDAFALAQAVSVVHGKLMYEGKVVTAVLESLRGIKLQFKWNGQTGDAHGIEVWDGITPEEGREPRVHFGTVAQWATKKKDGTRADAWKPGPDRLQLAYRGAREWCRLYEPGVILGVLFAEEPDAVERYQRQEEVTPPPAAQPLRPGFAKPAAARRAKARRPRFDQNQNPGPLVEEEAEAVDESVPAAAETSPAAGDEIELITPANKLGESTSVDLLGGPVIEQLVGKYENSHLPAAHSWSDIQAALNLLRRNALFAEHPELHAKVFAAAWHRVRQLMAQRKGRIDVSLTEDMLAFRCYIEAMESSVQISETWVGVQACDTFNNMPVKARLELSTLVNNRLRTLRFHEEEADNNGAA